MVSVASAFGFGLDFFAVARLAVPPRQVHAHVQAVHVQHTQAPAHTVTVMHMATTRMIINTTTTTTTAMMPLMRFDSPVTRSMQYTEIKIG